MPSPEHKHVRSAVTRRKSVHLHYKGNDESPLQHPDRLKKVQRRRTGTGMNKRRLNKWPKITVGKSYDEDGRYPWAIFVDNIPTYYRATREHALQHAREIRADIERVRKKQTRVKK